MNADPTPIGPARLFGVDPTGEPCRVMTADPFRVVLTTDQIAAAAIAAAGEAARSGHDVWIVSPDSWHAVVHPTGHVDGHQRAPLDAIRRAVAHTPSQHTNQHQGEPST